MGFAKVASVTKALEESWQMLAGTALHIVPSEQDAAGLEAGGLPPAQYFAISIRTNDGVERSVVLQISTPLLTTLTSAMFGEPDDALSAEQCQDAGKELANILSSCCIQHLSELANGEVGLPRRVSHQEMQQIEHSGTLAAHFLADSANDLLSLSIIEPIVPNVTLHSQ